MNKYCVVVFYKDQPDQVKYVVTGFKFSEHAVAISKLFDKAVAVEQIKG